MISFRIQFALVVIALCAVGPAFGQLSNEPGVQTATFRIGYVRQDPEAATTSGVYQRLREFLVSQPEVTQAMQSAGVEKIGLQSFESHPFLIEAMDAEQVDLAFCSVLDFAYQRGNYEPVFQIRRPGDPHSSTGDRRVWHSGAIFVNKNSALFNMETSTALAALPRYVMSHEIAMVGSSSAVGYVYPFLAMDRLTTSVPVLNARLVFWDSSAEVVKAVVNGIHEIGACDAAAINQVLEAHGLLDEKSRLVKEILRTDPVPRDPIVIHERWLAASSFGDTPATELGRQVMRGVAGFFQTDPSLPRLERTSREPFQEVAENLERFRRLRNQAGP